MRYPEECPVFRVHALGVDFVGRPAFVWSNDSCTNLEAGALVFGFGEDEFCFALTRRNPSRVTPLTRAARRLLRWTKS